jgi:hypothetical protein
MDGSFPEKVLPMFPDECVTHAPGRYMLAPNGREPRTAGAAHAILLVMRDGIACGAERLGEPSLPIGHSNLTCYLAPHRIFASEMAK